MKNQTFQPLVILHRPRDNVKGRVFADASRIVSVIGQRKCYALNNVHAERAFQDGIDVLFLTSPEFDRDPVTVAVFAKQQENLLDNVIVPHVVKHQVLFASIENSLLELSNVGLGIGPTVARKQNILGKRNNLVTNIMTDHLKSIQDFVFVESIGHLLEWLRDDCILILVVPHICCDCSGPCEILQIMDFLLFVWKKMRLCVVRFHITRVPFCAVDLNFYFQEEKVRLHIEILDFCVVPSLSQHDL